MSVFTLRRGKNSDLPFLQEMLYEAATWRTQAEKPPRKKVLSDPYIMRYVEQWGRIGDLAIIAENNKQEPLGAVWYRLFSEKRPGYGFLAPNIPELSIAVIPSQRRKGIAKALLQELFKEAKLKKLSALSLSVEEDNFSRNLYENLGFYQVKMIGNALTMRIDFVR